ncbi:MAG: fused MFS/spermidine synthase [Candidatus Micrarchaeota archaeon]
MVGGESRTVLIIAFISGMCSLLVEIAGSRVLAPFMGTTIYTWAAVIGLVLASLSAGYYLGGTLADRHHDRKHLSMILASAAIATVLVPFLGGLILPFTPALDLALASLVGAAILVPPSVFYGMVSPYAVKLTSIKGEEGKSAGMVFAVSTVGSIAGALGTGFILVPNLPLASIFILAGLLMLLCSFWGATKGSRLFELLPFALLAFFALQLDLQPLLPGAEVVYRADTQYYRIQVLDTVHNGGPARLLFLDNALSSGERPDGSPAFNYVLATREAYDAAGKVENALVIGSAAGTEIEELKRAFPSASVDGVDIDPKLFGIGQAYFSLEDDNRTEIFTDDARRYVRTTEKKYDLVVIDAFRGLSIPYHLTTKEFLSELKGAMAGDGVVIVNIISAVEGERSDIFVLMHNTFSSEFRNVRAIPVGDSPQKPQNIILVATDRDLSDFEEMHASGIYRGAIPDAEPLTDSLNSVDLYAVR